MPHVPPRHPGTLAIPEHVGAARPASSPVRVPRPLRPGSTIGVTAPSSGVGAFARARVEHAVAVLEARGYRVRLGECLWGDDAVVSAPAPVRAAELQAMLLDPDVDAVLPPWGGELGVDLLRLLDWDALAAADPCWVAGYSDTSTLLLPLTLRAGWATLHGTNLADLPFDAPDGHAHVLDVMEAPPGARVDQHAAAGHVAGWPDYAGEPTVSSYDLKVPSRWRPLDVGGAALDGAALDGAAGPVSFSGRLVGGCLETVSLLPGTPYGDVAGFAPGEPLVVVLEVAEDDALHAARALHHLRLAGWFDRASGVLVGRTSAPSAGGLTQDDAVRDALAGLGVPVVAGVDVGHVMPQLPLVLGAPTTVTLPADGVGRVSQELR